MKNNDIAPCVCLPNVGYKCRLCEESEKNPTETQRKPNRNPRETEEIRLERIRLEKSTERVKTLSLGSEESEAAEKKEKSSLTIESGGVISLAGYGYIEADQDGGTGKTISPEQHKEEEFFEALRQELDVKEI